MCTMEECTGGGRSETDRGLLGDKVNTDSTAIRSPGKISANVDIRDTRSRFANDYSAQSSVVKGTECLPPQIHYAK